MGVERTEAWKCTSCSENHDCIDSAIGCCGIEVELEWEVTIRGTSTISVTDTQELAEIKQAEFTDLHECHVNTLKGDLSVEVDYIEGEIKQATHEEVKQ